MSKRYDLFKNQPKGSTALWNRFGVGRDAVYMYSKALYRASLSLSVASRFDEHAQESDDLNEALESLKNPKYKQFLQRAQTKKGHARKEVVAELQTNLNCSNAVLCSALRIIEIREIESQRVATLTAGNAIRIAEILRLPLQYGNEPKSSNDLYSNTIHAEITLGPGHFYTRRYLDTPGFQHLCSFHSLGEVLAAMKSTRLDKLIGAIEDADVINKLQVAQKNGCCDLLSAHLYFLDEEKTTSSDEASLKAAAEQEVIHILEEINKLFDKEISRESKIIKLEQICMGGMAAGYTVLALSAVGIAFFASPDLLTMIGVSSIQGLDPVAVISAFAAIAVFCAVIAIASSVGASNNPGNEEKSWVRSDRILFDAKAPEPSSSEESTQKTESVV